MRLDELLEEIGSYYGVYVEIQNDIVTVHNEVGSYGSTITSIPINTLVFDTSWTITNAMVGVPLNVLNEILKLIKVYVATPLEQRAPKKLYHIQLPSGHYMRRLKSETEWYARVDWTLDLSLAGEYYDEDINMMDEAYLPFKKEIKQYENN